MTVLPEASLRLSTMTVPPLASLAVENFNLNVPLKLCLAPAELKASSLS